jgi:signal transduction histidine kinase
LDNLLSNAIKYSPSGGDVLVSVAVEDGGAGTGKRAVLTVQDQGVGIPKADLPRLFERFQRGTNVVGRFVGTGVGLASARHIVESHGGSIEVHSQEGRGTIVVVQLPLAEPA